MFLNFLKVVSYLTHFDKTAPFALIRISFTVAKFKFPPALSAPRRRTSRELLRHASRSTICTPPQAASPRAIHPVKCSIRPRPPPAFLPCLVYVFSDNVTWWCTTKSSAHVLKTVKRQKSANLRKIKGLRSKKTVFRVVRKMERSNSKNSIKTKACKKMQAFVHVGWGTWIRTKTNGVRVRCSTIKLFPNGWTRIYIRPLFMKCKNFFQQFIKNIYFLLENALFLIKNQASLRKVKTMQSYFP